MSRDYSFFCGNLCHICKAASSDITKMKRCSGCHMVAFCSIDHQKKYWKKHRAFCKSVQSLLLKRNWTSVFHEGRESLTVEEWKRLRFSSMFVVEMEMDRQLLPEEREMFLLPRVCTVCRESDQATLEDCDLCHCVSYCSETHRDRDAQRHNSTCSLLKLSYRLSEYLARSNNMISYPCLKIPMQEKAMSPSTMSQILETYQDHFENPDMEEDLYRALCSEPLSYPLSLLYAAERVGAPLCGAIVVHIVGAAYNECSFLEAWETVLHAHPLVNHLCLVLIGLELQPLAAPSINLCAACTIRDNRLSVDIRSTQSYGSYFESDSFSRPDFVVAFNCGLHEYEGTAGDTWSNSVPRLLHYPGVFLVLTSYTRREAEADVAVVVKRIRDVECYALCLENPFRGARPYRDWEREQGVFYQNAYVSVFARA